MELYIFPWIYKRYTILPSYNQYYRWSASFINGLVFCLCCYIYIGYTPSQLEHAILNVHIAGLLSYGKKRKIILPPWYHEKNILLIFRVNRQIAAKWIPSFPYFWGSRAPISSGSLESVYVTKKFAYFCCSESYRAKYLHLCIVHPYGLHEYTFVFIYIHKEIENMGI